MVDQQTVLSQLWPNVQQLVQVTMQEDEARLRSLLMPRRPAWLMYDLFGFRVMHILLKTILGRDQATLIGAVETNNGKNVHIEYAWLEEGSTEIAAADVVTVTLRRYRRHWLITDAHPSMLHAPLTEPHAQAMLASLKASQDDGQVPGEPWVLPYLLFGGALQLPPVEDAARDEVEALLLAGLQQRTHGIFSLTMGIKLWRDFKKRAQPQWQQPEAYAAAAEYLLSQLAGRKLTQAAIAGYYGLPLAKILTPVRQIKRGLKLVDEDPRYVPNQGTRIILNE